MGFREESYRKDTKLTKESDRILLLFWGVSLVELKNLSDYCFDYADAFTGLLEFYLAGFVCEQGVVFAPSHVCARIQFCAALPDDDCPGADELPVEFLYAQPF